MTIKPIKSAAITSGEPSSIPLFSSTTTDGKQNKKQNKTTHQSGRVADGVVLAREALEHPVDGRLTLGESPANRLVRFLHLNE